MSRTDLQIHIHTHRISQYYGGVGIIKVVLCWECVCIMKLVVFGRWLYLGGSCIGKVVLRKWLYWGGGCIMEVFVLRRCCIWKVVVFGW